MEIYTALSSIEAKYGFHFKEKQLSAIKTIVEGNDTFVVLPTGYFVYIYDKLLLFYAPYFYLL